MLTTQYAPAKQSGNGVIVAFDFSFKILAVTDLIVYRINAAGVLSAPLILGVDYTAIFDPIAETGTVTYLTGAPVTNGYSYIARVSDNTQSTSLPREGPAPAKTTETMIDKLMALIQEAQANILAIVVPPASGGGGVTGLTIQFGTFAALDAAAQIGTPFFGYATDQRLFQVFLGDRTKGDNGWINIAGGSA